ncbi:LysR family transcriptional regulator [Alcaligenes sp. 13f]|uniref:LysR family transcriptional regulator n=1 Tax=Alcaligenes sp. 13f TaxID=2841924 RepID=UPI001CF6DE95|nr:LysR family transcriptional regulator [Alcaligenes sp. 13f]MCB4321987.1 LysR family transcriptional regulator [Alcaligenes sp. 13f]
MIRELKTLLAVSRENSFAAAGAKIGLTQAAISAQMQRLENELGVKLFDRVGRSARLNRVGEEILLQAQEVLKMYENLGTFSTQPEPATLVRTGAIASVQRSLLPKAIAMFHRQLPTSRTHIVPGVSLSLLNAVDAGELDMAAIIRPPFSLHSDLRWTSLAREPFRLLVPSTEQEDDWAELLCSRPFIRYDKTSFGGRQVDRFLRERNLRVKQVCELDELEAITQLVINGVGVALVPQTFTQHRWPNSVRALDLGVATFHRDIGLVHRATNLMSTPAGVFARLICDLAQDQGNTHDF